MVRNFHYVRCLFTYFGVSLDSLTHHFPLFFACVSIFKLFNFNLYFYDLKLVQFIINEGSAVELGGGGWQRSGLCGEREVISGRHKNIDLH